tara:strand:- start:8729 stop:10825 length:2097 start_codon:yes stop_codon:yes gene_type:complete
MSSTESSGQVQKALGFFDVFAIATGATLSAGLFLLPGFAAQQAGPAVILCYLLAAIPLVPAMLCIVELGTAMPRSGGSYYFLERSLGPLAGTVGGLGTWLALILKTSFALVGLGAYLALFLPANAWLMKGIAVAFALFFGGLNVLGAKKAGGFQRKLVVGLLIILAVFLAVTSTELNTSHFDNFFGSGRDSILATTGVVYISYVGITKVASVSGEVRDPERNLPRGVFLSLLVALIVYATCTTVMVGVIPMEQLVVSTTPMADAAEIVAGTPGKIVLSIAAMLAFFSVSNAGILASSRYPLAMGQDQLVPQALCKVSGRGAPVLSIVLTVSVIVCIVLFLDPLGIAKLASAFQLMMFALLCGAVIVMRESGLASYDPGYKAPFYPWLPLFGLMAPFVLIFQMGWQPTLFSFGLIGAGVALYQGYGAKKVERRGAIFHVFAKLGESRHDPLDIELRTILKEKGLREQDPFEEVVLASTTIDLDAAPTFSDLIERVATALALRTGHARESFVDGFTEGTLKGATPVAKGVALPHMRLDSLDEPTMVLVRVRQEMHFLAGDVFGKTKLSDEVHAFFFLVSSTEDAGRHLRMLAQLATRIDQEDFLDKWLSADGEMQLREVFLRDDRYASVRVGGDGPARDWAGSALRDITLPDGCMIAAIRRSRQTLVPRGNTTLEEQDRLLIFGDPNSIAQIYGEEVGGS